MPRNEAQLRERPLLTEIFDQVQQFVPAPGSAYILGASVEERSLHSAEWETNAKDVLFIRIEKQEQSELGVEVEGRRTTISLRSSRQLSDFWGRIRRSPIYLDITGLAHHAWAPLLKAGLSSARLLVAIYVEPGDYQFSPTPTEGEIFDLSEKIVGISPLPGFASLVEPFEDQVCFVPLLGFEGIRLAYLIEQVQPPGGKVLPIIGVPGFRPEYPFYTYHGNRSVLSETRAWKNVRFALANCPFSLFYALEDVAADYPRDLLKIAPIGTKPHALGAILYALKSRRAVEIVYDHPIRKAKRTEGTGRLLVYHLSTFAGF